MFSEIDPAYYEGQTPKGRNYGPLLIFGLLAIVLAVFFFTTRSGPADGVTKMTQDMPGDVSIDSRLRVITLTDEDEGASVFEDIEMSIICTDDEGNPVTEMSVGQEYDILVRLHNNGGIDNSGGLLVWVRDHTFMTMSSYYDRKAFFDVVLGYHDAFYTGLGQFEVILNSQTERLVSIRITDIPYGAMYGLFHYTHEPEPEAYPIPVDIGCAQGLEVDFDENGNFEFSLHVEVNEMSRKIHNPVPESYSSGVPD